MVGSVVEKHEANSLSQKLDPMSVVTAINPQYTQFLG